MTSTLTRPVAPQMSKPVRVTADPHAMLTDQGWTTRFRLLQPKNPMFWGYWLLIGTGLVFTVQRVQSTLRVYPLMLAVDIAVLVVFGAAIWALLRKLDRYRKMPISLVIVAFLWGALPAGAFMAAYANDAEIALYGKIFGQAWAASWATGLTAGFDEEIAKGVGLVVLLALARGIIRKPLDAFILGGFVGLGFQLVEDVTYVTDSVTDKFGANPAFATFQTLFVRIETGFSSHFLYTAIFSCGLLLVIGTVVQPRRIWLGLGLMAFSVVLHGVWDDQGIFGGSMLVVAVLTVIIVAMFVTVWNFAIRDENRVARLALAALVTDPALTDAELGAITGRRCDRRRFVRHGPGSLRHTRTRLIRAGRAVMTATRAPAAERAAVARVGELTRRLRENA